MRFDFINCTCIHYRCESCNYTSAGLKFFLLLLQQPCDQLIFITPLKKGFDLATVIFVYIKTSHNHSDRVRRHLAFVCKLNAPHHSADFIIDPLRMYRFSKEILFLRKFGQLCVICSCCYLPFFKINILRVSTACFKPTNATD